jgi:hypothetical protein
LCLVLLPLLASCTNEPETIVAGNADPQARELAKAAPVELPPAIAASRTYRCKDNSLLYADFFTNSTVNVRLGDRNSAPTKLAAADATAPYTGDGYSISKNASTVQFTAPGKGAQSCKA